MLRRHKEPRHGEETRLAAKIRAVQAMSAALDVLIAERSGGALPVDDCPILTALEAVSFEAKGTP